MAHKHLSPSLVATPSGPTVLNQSTSVAAGQASIPDTRVTEVGSKYKGLDGVVKYPEA